MSVRYYVRYQTKPGCAPKFVQEMTETGAWDAFKKDKGCLSYKFLYEADDPDCVILMEEWETVEDELAHRELPHLKYLWEAKAKYVIGMERHRCDFFD